MRTILFLFFSTAPFYPQSQFLLEREGYVVNFDARTRNPCWVYEHLTQLPEFKKNEKRKRYRFWEDLSLPYPFRTGHADFRFSGFDRGHLCPFADLPDSSAKETYLFSNISPQDPVFNRGLWQKLEKYVRNLTYQYEELHVYTFPLFLSELDLDGKRYVRYQVIGKKQIAVPTHFAKAIFARGGEEIEVFAFLLPNDELDRSLPLEKFLLSLDQLESLSGLIFPDVKTYLSPPKGVE